jgi:hypothetical protein
MDLQTAKNGVTKYLAKQENPPKNEGKSPVESKVS